MDPVSSTRQNSSASSTPAMAVAKTTLTATTAATPPVEDSVVVPEPFPMRRIPPKVLTEDDYTDAVSHIIERDFFPDLPHLRIKHELLEARASGEQALANALRWKLVNMGRPTPLSTVGAVTPGRLTPGATPLPGMEQLGAATPAGATPQLSAWERDDDVESLVAAQSDAPGHARLKLANGHEVVVDLQRVRLDDFQRVFTSEDNASFEELMKRDNEKKKDKQWWIENAELLHNTAYQRYVKAILEGGQTDRNNNLLGNEFQARNAMSFHPHTLPHAEIVEKPRVDVKNTRFTTSQQAELDAMLGVAVASRAAHHTNEQELEAGDRMARSGSFGISAFAPEVRAVGGRMCPAFLPAPEVRGYPMVRTPDLLPGVGGLSPLMTYGKLGSTPRALEEEGPSFRMNEASQRELAAERLQRGATQKLREAKQQTKAEKFRALGLTPPGTPSRTSRSTPGAGSTGRFTPGSARTKVTPLSPIGAMIQQAQRLSQKGGRLRIGHTPPPTPDEGPRKSRKRSSRETPAVDSERLPASITDDLL